MKHAKWFFGILFILILEGCPFSKTSIAIPTGNSFDGDFAKTLVKIQTEFGPRVSGTPASVRAGDWIVSLLQQFKLRVIEQKHSGGKYPIRNIIASVNPDKKDRILFTAHWDTRYIADQDTEKTDKPGPGANDGGSGVAVLLEMARILGQNPPIIGVDFIFWDAEDNGGHEEDSYCLGSQYWGKNPHVPHYRARFGVNLDMVGAPGARFPIEGYSASMGGIAVNKVLAAASKVGTTSFFERVPAGYITDDHLYVMKATKIPMMDVIHLRSEGGFFEHWHTHRDTADKISPQTLKAVGDTMLQVVREEK